MARIAKVAPPVGGSAAREFFLWPCNVEAWHHWMAVQTMWRSDGGERTGLCVQDLHAYMELCGVLHVDRQALYALLHECELEALQVYANLREQDERERARRRSLER